MCPEAGKKVVIMVHEEGDPRTFHPLSCAFRILQYAIQETVSLRYHSKLLHLM